MQAITISRFLSGGKDARFSRIFRTGVLIAPGMCPPLNSNSLRGSTITGASNGLVARYTQDPKVDGMPHGEGMFLACSFWLADNYCLQNRREDAVRMFERLLNIRNDLGLLSEEYDPVQKRLLGNFPQAFSHVGLVNTAMNLSRNTTQPLAGPNHGASSR